MSDDDMTIEVGGLVNTDTGRDRVAVAYTIGGEVLVRLYPPVALVPLEQFASGGDGGSIPPTAILTLSPHAASGVAELLGTAAGCAAEEAGVCSGCGEPVDDGDGAAHDTETESCWVHWLDPETLAAASDTLDHWLAFYRQALADGEPRTTAQIAEHLIIESQRVAARTAITIISLATAIQRLVSGDR